MPTHAKKLKISIPLGSVPILVATTSVIQLHIYLLDIRQSHPAISSSLYESNMTYLIDNQEFYVMPLTNDFEANPFRFDAARFQGSQLLGTPFWSCHIDI
jgi:hypothetical protein